MFSRSRKLAQKVLRRWPRVYQRAKRGYARLAFRLGIPHDPEFRLFAALAGIVGLFVDIGANAGQSARSLRIFNRSLQILSFEPNRMLEPDLALTKRLLGTSFDYRMVGLGKVPERATLAIPAYRGAPQTAWATTDPSVLEANRAKIEDWLGGPFEIVEVPIEIIRFDSLDLHPVAVKVDVEGLEADVVMGMEETLRTDEPLLMLEHSDGADDLIAWLRERGYAIYLYDAAANQLKPTTMPRQTTNYFACTPGWLTRFPAVAALIERQQPAEHGALS
jgi:FkbM family methyltransferase